MEETKCLFEKKHSWIQKHSMMMQMILELIVCWFFHQCVQSHNTIHPACILMMNHVVWYEMLKKLTQWVVESFASYSFLKNIYIKVSNLKYKKPSFVKPFNSSFVWNDSVIDAFWFPKEHQRHWNSILKPHSCRLIIYLETTQELQATW